MKVRKGPSKSGLVTGLSVGGIRREPLEMEQGPLGGWTRLVPPAPSAAGCDPGAQRWPGLERNIGSLELLQYIKRVSRPDFRLWK